VLSGLGEQKYFIVSDGHKSFLVSHDQGLVDLQSMNSIRPTFGRQAPQKRGERTLKYHRVMSLIEWQFRTVEWYRTLRIETLKRH
jgi:hypothetical protein